MTRTSSTNRDKDYNRIYMRQYRTTDAGIRQKRIGRLTQELVLKWMRANLPDTYKDIRQQAINQVDAKEELQ